MGVLCTTTRLQRGREAPAKLHIIVCLALLRLEPRKSPSR